MLSKSDRIKMMLLDGVPARQIALECQCHVSRVYQIKNQLGSQRERLEEKVDRLVREVQELKYILRQALNQPEDIIAERLRQIH